MIIQGDALTVLKRMDSESVHMSVTSSPYYGLRSYGTEPIIWDGDPNCQHEWGEVHPPGYRKSDTHPGPMQHEGNKNRENLKSDICTKCGAWRGELGQEPSPEMFVKHLTTIFHELKRVLRNDGIFWMNIGDSYNGSGKAGNNPEYQKAKAEDINDSLSRGFKWQRMSSGKRVLVHPITKQEVTNQKGEPIVLNESEYAQYNKDHHVDSGGQDNKLPVMGEGLRRHRKK